MRIQKERNDKLNYSTVQEENPSSPNSSGKSFQLHDGIEVDENCAAIESVQSYSEKLLKEELGN